MTDHASHGDASPECTRTPFVIWGPGVSRGPGIPESCARMSRSRKPSIVSHVIWHALMKLDVHDVLGWRAGRVPWACAACRDVPWSMDAPERLDIHQAQLAPLMAALLGVPVPTNGMFTLPLELISSDSQDGTAPYEFRAKVRTSAAPHGGPAAGLQLRREPAVLATWPPGAANRELAIVCTLWTLCAVLGGTPSSVRAVLRLGCAHISKREWDGYRAADLCEVLAM